MTLLDIFDATVGSQVRVVSSRTGKVLLHNFENKHFEHYGQLEVRCIQPKMYLIDNCCYSRLVVSVHEDEFNTAKDNLFTRDKEEY